MIKVVVALLPAGTVGWTVVSQEGSVVGKYVLVNAPAPTPCELPIWPASGHYVSNPDSTWISSHEFETDHCPEQWHVFHGKQTERGTYTVAGNTLLLRQSETEGRPVESVLLIVADTLLVSDESGTMKYVRAGV